MKKEIIYCDGFAAEKAAKEEGFTLGGTDRIPNIGLIHESMLKSVIERKRFKHTLGSVWGVKINKKGEEIVKNRLSSGAEFRQGELLFV